MSGGSALIFGINYAPEISGNAPYTAGLARHLADDGWGVEVVTGYPHYPQWRKQPAPRRSSSQGVLVHRHRHYVPRHPTAIRRGLLELSWVLAALPTAWRRREVDVVVGVVPNLGAAVLSRLAARRIGVPYVLWIQDVMGLAAAQGGTKGGGSVAGLVGAVERWAARGAERLLVVAESFRAYFEHAGVAPDRIARVRNWGLLPPSNADRTTTLRSLGVDPASRVALHSGNMGAKQGLDIILGAASQATEITFVLQGNGNARPDLERQVHKRHLDNVMFKDQLPAQTLSNLLSASDALLITQRPSVDDMSLPSKITSYAGAGTPIVATVAPQSETAREVRGLGGRIVPQPAAPDAVAAAIREAVERPGRPVLVTPCDPAKSLADITAILDSAVVRSSSRCTP